jgi:hypothetical protein
MNESRRKFLKIIFISSGTLLAEKILGPLLSFLDAQSAKSDSSTSFRNFRVVEDKKVLSVYDSSGKEILQIDRGV